MVTSSPQGPSLGKPIFEGLPGPSGLRPSSLGTIDTWNLTFNLIEQHPPPPPRLLLLLLVPRKHGTRGCCNLCGFVAASRLENPLPAGWLGRAFARWGTVPGPWAGWESPAGKPTLPISPFGGKAGGNLHPGEPSRGHRHPRLVWLSAGMLYVMSSPPQARFRF